jgi:hypothetical protein
LILVEEADFIFDDKVFNIYNLDEIITLKSKYIIKIRRKNGFTKKNIKY